MPSSAAFPELFAHALRLRRDLAARSHSFEISARDAARVERAQLVIANGLGLEGGIANTVAGARGAAVPVLEIAPAVRPL
nr:zinc ABC transporter substrate-binding protein [Tomitella biformata]